MRRAPCPEWPTLLCPAVGCYPPASPQRKTERVLHAALYPTLDAIPALLDAFRTISTDVSQVDHVKEGPNLPDALYAAAAKIRPTIVFAQMQMPTALADASVVAKLRALCDPECVIVQWDGDLHDEPRDPGRSWFVDLGRVIDASLTVETQYPAEYAALGVKHPGFLEVGVADGWADFSPPTSCGVPPVVLLAGRTYLKGYVGRHAAVAACEQWYGPRGFGVYGNGWDQNPCARPHLSPGQELGAYRDAKVALSASIRNDVARYTSDRLFRALYAGAVLAVEEFPDCAGLGLEQGRNCMLWDGIGELHDCLEFALAMPDTQRTQMRDEAAKLGRQNTWSARMVDLLAIVDAIREERRRST